MIPSSIYVDWSTVGTVHVFDVEIIPHSTYEVQAIGYGCELGDEEDYSNPLEITTCKWADLVGLYLLPPPPSAPNGSVDITDVIAILDKFNNVTGNVMKARADIEPSPPDVMVNMTDATYALDAFRGFPYPFDDIPFEECEAPPPVGGCEADIRVDSNNDGVIDFIDDFLEETQGVTVVFNADDDNENEIADWEETNVTGEDDLIEMQLSAPSCAPGMWTTWSLSWDSGTPLKVWWYSDKYCPDCPPGEEDEPVHNLNEYPTAIYPFDLLPLSVWLEATDATGDDFEITFTIHAATEQRDASLPSRASDKDDKVKTKAEYGAPFTIKLRAVMVVEPEADLDDPRPYTGGTKLTRTEVKELMQQLVDYGSDAVQGVTFDWNPNDADAVIKLESECMLLAPIPYLPNFSLHCYSQLDGGNPRATSLIWYEIGLMGRGSDESLNQDGCINLPGLTCPEDPPPEGVACYDNDPSKGGYIYDRCTINVYFIGGFSSSEDLGYGGAPDFPWDPSPSRECWETVPVVMIADGAGNDGGAPANKDMLAHHRVLEHEVACHYLPGRGHMGDENLKESCDDGYLCHSGAFMETCWRDDGLLVFDRIPVVKYQLQSSVYYKDNCGDKR